MNFRIGRRRALRLGTLGAVVLAGSGLLLPRSGRVTSAQPQPTAPAGPPAPTLIVPSPGAGVRDPNFFQGTVLGRLGDRITILDATTKKEEEFRLGSNAKIASGFPVSADSIATGDSITAGGRAVGSDKLIIATVVDLNVAQVRGIVKERTSDGWNVQDALGQMRPLVLDRARPPLDITGATLAPDALLRNYGVGAGMFAVGVWQPDGSIRATKIIVHAATLR